MKTQIITLESHDDLISVRDRLSWAKTPRILLVWPKFEKVTLRQVDLKVLQRHASSLGAQLGLVTRARRVREDAEGLGIPVFESAGQAQRVAWPLPGRKRLPHHVPDRTLREKRKQISAGEEAWRTHPAVRVGAFAVGVFSVLLLVALFIPRAQVVLHPVSKTQSIVLPVTASPSVDSVFITGSIPLREKKIILDGAQTVVVTGEGAIPQSKAAGLVVFRNLTQEAVTVPAGTVILTADDIRFVTTEGGAVDASVGRTLELPVQAVEGGIGGNVEADMLVAIEGRLGLSLSVTNPEPTSGGRELASVQANDEDRNRARSLLMQSLEEEARKRFEEENGEGDLLFDKTLAVSQILSEVYDPPPGAAGTKLTLTMQVEYSVRYAAASDLTALASLALNASLPPAFSPASDDVTLVSAAAPIVDRDGSARWTMRVERRIVQSIDPAFATRLVQGYTSSAARSRLAENLSLASPPEILLFPSWWPRVPIVPFRISVVTK